MAAVGAEGQGLHARNGRQLEIAIKVRKQRAAARRLPFQSVAEFCAVDAHQQQTVLASEMLPSGFDDLIGAREMNEAVAAIDFGAVKDSSALSRPPQ